VVKISYSFSVLHVYAVMFGSHLYLAHTKRRQRFVKCRASKLTVRVIQYLPDMGFGHFPLDVLPGHIPWLPLLKCKKNVQMILLLLLLLLSYRSTYKVHAARQTI